MRTKELINVALKAGEILLCSGAEVYRVEETIVRIFKSYNVQGDCFVLLSGIFISAKSQDGETITIVKRIKNHTIDLKKIESINTFSRNLESEPLSYTEAMDELSAIESESMYTLRARVLFAGATAFIYALLFNSSLGDAAAALFISMLVYLVKSKISDLGFFKFLEFFISGIILSISAIFAVRLLPVLDLYKILIGSLMILVPGLAITTGIKDALYGDIVSSLYRITEAVFISAAVGSGVGIILSIGLRYV